LASELVVDSGSVPEADPMF